MKMLFLAIVILFAIIGIAHIIFEILYRFFKIKDDDSFIVIIPNKNNEIDIEFKVRSSIAKLKKLFKSGKGNIFVISDDLSQAEKKELSLLQKDFSYLTVLSKEEFIKKAGL